MDLVIVMPGLGFVRLSPYNKNILRDANGTIVNVSYDRGFYHLDNRPGHGTQMRDVTAAWRVAQENGDLA